MLHANNLVWSCWIYHNKKYIDFVMLIRTKRKMMKGMYGILKNCLGNVAVS